MKCRSVIGFFLGHKWRAVKQIVPTHNPDPTTYLGRHGYQLSWERFCSRCRMFEDQPAQNTLQQGTDMSENETKSSLVSREIDNLAFAQPTSSLMFHAGNSEWLFRIVYEGNGAARVELSEGVTWDEAGKLFWETVERLKPAQNTAQPERISGANVLGDKDNS